MMLNQGVLLPGMAAATLLLYATLPVSALAGDLSKYRDFQFGMTVTAVVTQMGASQSDIKDIHLRPALIQELEWHPQPLGWSDKTEAAENVTFGFYNGALFRIAIVYDRRETEGLTAADMVELISSAYGSATELPRHVKAEPSLYGEQEAVLARWQDPQYGFELRSLYGPTYRLIGISRKLDTLAKAAALEAVRLEAQEAPQREATRIAAEQATGRADREKARLLNKPKFRL